MRPANTTSAQLQKPVLIQQAKQLDAYLKSLSLKDLQTTMKISASLAEKVSKNIAEWNDEDYTQRAAIDAFLGDIYSGLQVSKWTEDDRNYANSHLYILSGLYGVLRALDGISPYRLEMAYRFPNKQFANLYSFWGEILAKSIPGDKTVVNLASVEYSKAILPYLTDRDVITPIFLTQSPKNGEPTFVAVHAKIARGAFARWMVQHRIDSISELKNFKEIGYSFDATQSTPESPVYVCSQFGGIGLSMRLT